MQSACPPPVPLPRRYAVEFVQEACSRHLGDDPEDLHVRACVWGLWRYHMAAPREGKGVAPVRAHPRSAGAPAATEAPAEELTPTRHSCTPQVCKKAGRYLQDREASMLLESVQDTMPPNLCRQRAQRGASPSAR
eukprot:4335168-Alexandrium_andersonii.AAC.1